MADMKYDIDSSDLVRTRKEIRSWARDNANAFTQVNSRMQTFGKTSELAFNQFGRAATQAQQKSKRFASVGLQQAGYQIGDFAVQLQGGTNAAVAFGQQMSQLLGIFGAGGAVAGAGVAIATAFIAPLLDSRKAAQESNEAISDFTSALSDYQNQVEIAGRSTQSLTEEFGELAGEVRSLSEFFQEVAVSRALDALKTGTATFSAGLEDAAERATLLNEQINRLGDVQPGDDRFALIATIRRRAEDAAKALGLTTDQSIRLQDTLSSIDESQSLVSLRDNTLTALQTIEGMTFESGKIPPEISKIVEKLREVLGASARATAETGNIKDNASGIADEMERAANKALDFVNNLGKASLAGLRAEVAALESGGGSAAVAAAKREAEVRASPEFQRALQGPSGLREQALSGLQSEVEKARERALLSERRSELTRSKTSGKSGGSGKTPKDPRAFLESLQRELDLKRLLVGVNDETAERLKLEARLKEELLETGGKITEADRSRIESLVKQAEAIRQAEAAEERRRANIERFEQQMSDSITNIVSEAQSIEDAFIGVIRNIVAELFKQNVADPIAGGIGDFVGGLFGGGGGSKPNLLNIAAGFTGAPKFAKGGAFTNGVVDKPTMFPMGQMGEAGPEAIMPLKRGKGGKLGVAAEGGSGGGSVTVNNNFHIAANGDDSVKRIIQQEAPKISAMTEKQIINSRRRGGSLKQAFG